MRELILLAHVPADSINEGFLPAARRSGLSVREENGTDISAVLLASFSAAASVFSSACGCGSRVASHECDDPLQAQRYLAEGEERHRIDLGDREIGWNLLIDKKVDLCAVFVECRPQLQRAALKILGDVEHAQDVVQDAYLKVIDAAGVFEIKEPVAYLFQLVRNLAIDAHRRAALEARLFVGEEQAAEVPGRSGTPESITASRQDLHIVSNALELDRPARDKQREGQQQLSELIPAGTAGRQGALTSRFITRKEKP